MSNVIDSRVVEMRFDNQQFEKGVQQSIGTLDKLKQSLNFSNVNVADKINLSGIGTALSSVGEKFTAFEAIALGALTRIGAQAVELGERLVKSLSIDQLSAGWSKYEQKTGSVQTIMAATAKQFSDTGVQMDYVNQQLDKLNWFTDETSYNFVDMVGNIGKFTSNNIPLDDAVTSMQGIANWAAISGQNAATASRAMYNLAQAIGVGTVKLIDWRSIETANMATAEFKENVLETAANLGTLVKTADGFETVGKHTKVTIENFSAALQEGWFTKEVLQQTLSLYGSATNKLYELSQVSGLTATDLLTLTMAQKENTLTQAQFEAAVKKSNVSAEELRAGIEELAKDEYDLGIRSLKAAQEAKTFTEAIDSVKDAVSTGWMKSFELMFGDYEHARVLWTDVANALWDIFAAGGEARNILLGEWVEAGGRELLGEGLLNILYSISDAVSLARETWAEFFGSLSGEKLKGITERFRDLTSVLRLYDDDTEELTDAGTRLHDTFGLIFEAGQNVFTIFQNGGRILKSFLDSLGPVTEATGKFAKSVIQLFTAVTGRVGDYLGTVDLTKEFGQVSAFAAEVINFLTGKVDSLRVMFEQWKPGAALKWLGDQFGTVRTVIADFFKTTEDGVTPFQKILNMFEGLKEKLGGLKTFFEPATKFFQDLWQNILAIFDLKGVDNIFEAMGKILTNGINLLFKGIKAIVKNVSLGDLFEGFLTLEGINIFKLGNRINWILESVWENLHGFANVFDQIRQKGLGSLFGGSGVFGEFFDIDISWWVKNVKILAESLLMVGAALLLVAAALAIIANIDAGDLIRSMQTLALVFGGLALGMISFAAAIKALDINPVTLVAGAAAMLIFAAALIVLAGAVALFALVAKMDTMWEGIAAMAVTLVIVSAALAALANNVNGLNLIAVSAAVLVFSAALLVLAVALEAFVLIAKQGDAAVNGLLLMTAALLALTLVLLALSAAGPMVIVAAAAILVLSAALLVLAVALEAFVLITNQGAAAIAGLGVMVASFMLLAGVLAIISLIAPQVLVAAAAMLVAGAALIVVAAGVAAAAVALTALGLGIEAVIAGFGIAIGTAVAALGAGFGAALAAVGWGIETLLASFGKGIGEGITFIAEGIGAGAEVIAVALAAFGEVVGTAFESLSQKIQNGLKTISVGIDAIKESLTGVGASITEIGTGIENFGNSVKTLASIPLISIGSGLSEVAKGLKDLNKNKFTGDATNIESYVTALSNLSQVATQIATLGVSLKTAMLTLGNDMALSLATGIQNSIGTVSAAGITMVNNLTVSLNGAAIQASNAGISIANNFVRGIQIGQSSAYNAGYNLGINAYNGANAVTGWFSGIGYNMAAGMASGLWSGAASVYQAAYSIASTASNVVRNALAVRSPSRVFAEIGRYMALGMAIGIEEGTGAVVDSSERMADSAIDGVSNAMSRIIDTLNSDIDTSPVITPVIDMSNIEKGSREISDLLSANQYALDAVGNISFDHMATKQAAYDRENRGTIATIDAATLAALANNNPGASDVTINFNGTLAQLAAVLQPAITVETKRIGEKLVNA